MPWPCQSTQSLDSSTISVTTSRGTGSKFYNYSLPENASCFQWPKVLGSWIILTNAHWFPVIATGRGFREIRRCGGLKCDAHGLSPNNDGFIQEASSITKRTPLHAAAHNGFLQTVTRRVYRLCEAVSTRGPLESTMQIASVASGILRWLMILTSSQLSQPEDQMYPNVICSYVECSRMLDHKWPQEPTTWFELSLCRG